MEKTKRRRELEAMYSEGYVDMAYGSEWGIIGSGDSVSGDSVEEYVCKVCGARFRKPEGLKEYRGHILRCRKQSKQ